MANHATMAVNANSAAAPGGHLSMKGAILMKILWKSYENLMSKEWKLEARSTENECCSNEANASVNKVMVK